MTRARPFVQVDVFGAVDLGGNPLAVVLDADGLTTEEMRAFARWTNLSETTFLLPPSASAADYRVRIFTPGRELPFGGHPTLGSAHAWREAGGEPARPGTVVQECGVGLVELREGDVGLAFAGPPTTVTPLGRTDRVAVAAALGIDTGLVRDAAVLDNGPHWTTLLLDSAETVLGLRPDLAALAAVADEVGVVGPHPAGGPAAIEVRAFAPALGIAEDPATGSLNASVATWLVGAGALPDHYVAAQGTAMGRAARIVLTTDPAGTTWVGGAVRTVVAGSVHL